MHHTRLTRLFKFPLTRVARGSRAQALGLGLEGLALLTVRFFSRDFQLLPHIGAADVPETVRFYTEVLGFGSSWIWGDPPTFGAAISGSITVMFSYSPELVGRVEGHGHWFDVEDVNGLHAQHLERGAMIVSPLEDKPWGKREYTVAGHQWLPSSFRRRPYLQS